MIRCGRAFKSILLFCLIAIPGYPGVRAEEECPNLTPETKTSFPAPPPLSKYSCNCVSGNDVLNCSCDENSIDHLNNNILHSRLSAILQHSYFRYFKVNLHRDCPFWRDNDRCSIRDCSVETCSADELPPTFRNDQNSKHDLKNQQLEEACAKEEELSSVDSSLNAQQKADISTWDLKMNENDFCVIDDEASNDCSYIDLFKNPERYTGYVGPSANRVWRTIYVENCFKPSKEQPIYSLTKSMQNEECEEKRAFFRVISGLHSSISIHLCTDYLLPFAQWGPNIPEFVRRFDDDHTDGEGRHRLSNLYFTYSIILRALQKARSKFDHDQFFTGDTEEDLKVQKNIQEILSLIDAFPHQFDERRLFCGEPAEAARLKEEFRLHFRNVSRIMDCVGCEKCRLWGKLQTQGIGTALKILFSNEREMEGLKFRRSEVVSLWNTFGRLSSSVTNLANFREWLKNPSLAPKTEKVSSKETFSFLPRGPSHEL